MVVSTEVLALDEGSSALPLFGHRGLKVVRVEACLRKDEPQLGCIRHLLKVQDAKAGPQLALEPPDGGPWGSTCPAR